MLARRSQACSSSLLDRVTAMTARSSSGETDPLVRETSSAQARPSSDIRECFPKVCQWPSDMTLFT